MALHERDLPYILPDCLYFEGLIAAGESINCIPNGQTGPGRAAIEMVTGQRPYARPFKFGQPGLCHVRRQDSPDIRAEWCIFLTHIYSTQGASEFICHSIGQSCRGKSSGQRKDTQSNGGTRRGEASYIGHTEGRGRESEPGC
jgi:hypothetical protein